jgi:excinuclease ABC subunit C
MNTTRRGAPPPDSGFDDDGPDAGEAEGAAPELDLDDAHAPALPGALGAGIGVIQRHLKTAPNAPGVYRMLGGDGGVLYVGKAKSIRKRIAAYARGQAHTNRIVRMIAETAAMEFVVTETETEALLLEANLIKQLRPRYNVLLRDDKSFPYILITGDHAAAQITKHRGARTRKGDYFGPFANAGAVNRTLNALQKAFLLRSCSDSVYENRTRPCLLFQIKRCAAPCTAEIAPADYAKLVEEARAFLSGRSGKVKEALSDEMQAAAEALEFEKAARLRDRIAALSTVTSTQGINPRSVEEADVFALAEEAGQFCVEAFFFRNFQNWGNRAYFPKADRTLPAEEVLGALVAQFYDDRPAPRLVLISHDIPDMALTAQALSARAGFRVEIAAPKRGEKRDLVEHARHNAREALARRLADTSAQGKLLAALGRAFGLPAAPRRVEVYDNSHIQGSNAVGAMIVAGGAGFMKPHYRTFNIRSDELTPGDDFGMMREVLTRRFSRLLKEHAPCPYGVAGASGGEAPAEPDAPDAGEAIDDDTFPAWPDLIVIDGGKGQLAAAREALAAIGIPDAPLVAIAKGPDRNAGRETFFTAGREPFRLEPRDPALYFLQRLRDEAHRFAIGTHRARRQRDLTKNPLDEIEGVGPRRKRALLLHFGTVKAVSRASLDDLATAPGVNEATARAVYAFFHPERG